jgi:hypothetical protein
MVDGLAIDGAAGRPHRSAGSPVSTVPAGRDNTIWVEKQVKISGRGAYELVADRLQFEHVEVDSQPVRLALRGRIDQSTREPIADVQGEVEYDLDALTVRLRNVLGQHVRLRGRGRRPFRLSGPLWASDRMAAAAQPVHVSMSPDQVRAATPGRNVSPELEAETGLGWDSGDLLGVPIGPGELTARLRDGVVRFQAVDIEISEGRLTAAPRMEVNRRPVLLALGEGPVLNHVNVSHQLCRSWLKYIAPLVADATRAEGTISASLRGAQIPVSAPEQGEFAGTLTIHSAGVCPGPLAQPVLELVNHLNSILRRGASPSPWLDPTDAWLEIDQQRVEFSFADQRFHHQSLDMHVKDILIRTRGSVGLDHSLSLVAEVPIRDAWVQQNRWLGSLRGQVLRVPIQGSLARPELDRRVVQEITRQISAGAARNLVQEELRHQLDKLLRAVPK